MLTVKALKEQLQDHCDRVEAIVALAQEEKRDLTAEETAEIDGIQGVGDKGEEGYKPGKIDEVQAKLDRALKIEANQKRIAGERGKREIQPEIGEDVNVLDRVILPASAKRSNFKSFIGPDAAKEAYIAGQFYSAVLGGNQHAKEWLDRHGMPIQAAMSGSSNGAGGYTVPEIMDSNIIRLVEEYGVALRECRTVPMSSDVLLVPRRSAGFTSYWVGQNTAITASDLTFEQVRLEAKKLAVLTSFSTELAEDTVINLGDLLTQEFAFQAAYDLDNALFNGDGSGTYGGIIGLKNALAAGAIQTDGASDDTFAEVVIGEFESAMGLVKQYPGARFKWYVHSSGFYNVMQRLAMAAGGSTVENYQNGSGPMFLGYPVVFSQVLQSGVGTTDLSNLIWAYFGDLSLAATIGLKRGISIAQSAEYGFNTDSIYARMTMRCDVQVHEIGTASAAGPIVALKMGS